MIGRWQCLGVVSPLEGFVLGVEHPLVGPVEGFGVAVMASVATMVDATEVGCVAMGVVVGFFPAYPWDYITSIVLL